jgi:hypothetical protein
MFLGIGAVVVATLDGRLEGADFLRGDPNGDGTAGVADAVYILDYLFTGGPMPECWASADIDADKRIDVSDPMSLLSSLFLRGPAIPDPFPAPGPGGAGDLPCVSYGGGEPLIDPKARAWIADAVAPGGGDRGAVVSIRVQGLIPFAGFSFRIVEPARVAESLRTGDPEVCSGFLTHGVDVAWFLGGSCFTGAGGTEILVGQVNSFAGKALILPEHDEDGMALVETSLCLSPTAKAGSYVLSLAAGELASEDGRTIRPVLVDGVLEILADVLPNAPCLTCFDKPPPPAPFLRGDANGDLWVDLSDALATLFFLFAGGETPPCLDAADANDDGRLDLSDPLATLESLFIGAGPLPEPSEEAGSDPTPDGLDCRS